MTDQEHLKIGSLFAGYGGLDLAITSVFSNTETVWVSEVDPHPAKVLAYRYPNAPNLGDITQINWNAVQPVDIICGGSPCQDLSMVGMRAGMLPGTRSGLWETMLLAINTIKPSYAIWENVGGARSAKAFSCMEPRTGRVGDTARRPAIRALGRVLGDLAGIGYDAQWVSVLAAHAGAPHHRERVFVLAKRDGSHAGDWLTEPAPPVCMSVDSILPTPQASVYGDGDPENWRKRNQKLMDATGGCFGPQTEMIVPLIEPDGHGPWSVWTDAFRRWEKIAGYPVPELTVTIGNGKTRTSQFFIEWLMGLPQGWVTGVPGVSRRAAMKMLGNGVVPQQAALALKIMLARFKEYRGKHVQHFR